jgi:hypothetical protein
MDDEEVLKEFSLGKLERDDVVGSVSTEEKSNWDVGEGGTIVWAAISTESGIDRLSTALVGCERETAATLSSSP